jgi:hypothetical protein
MPNGHATAEYIEQLERFFTPFAREITDFAARHNLVLEKYYHDAPMWSLGFGHPLGGQARLDATRSEVGVLCLGASWWIDDYDSFTRSIRTKEAIPVSASGKGLTSDLEQLLNDVLGWKTGAWTQVATGYKGIWDKTWTKAQFEAASNQWPRLR